jgi:CDP-2,3-bis-(O-geranylgeranyl)-sn-glycerol synthase
MNFLILIIRLIYLLVPAAFANMAPPIFNPFLSRLALSPLDGGRKFRGRPIFGSHKTWGGTLTGIMVGIFAAYLQHRIDPSFGVLALVDYSNWSIVGFLLGAGAMSGDLLKSFIKRQLDIKPGQLWIPFDEIDFVFGALLFLSPIYFPGWINAAILLMISFFGHILISLLGFYLKLRKRKEVVGIRFGQFFEELIRKEGRLIAGTLFIMLSVFLYKRWGIDLYRTVIYCLFIVNLIVDYLRSGLKINIPFYSQWGKVSFGRDNIHPITFMFIGLVLALQVASFKLIMAGLAMYIYGDSAAAIFGKSMGHVKIFKKKTLEGCVSMLAFSMLGGAFFISNPSLLFLLALIATILELFLLKLPDAMIIPLVVSLIGKFLEGGVV